MVPKNAAGSSSGGFLKSETRKMGGKMGDFLQKHGLKVFVKSLLINKK
ncbi:hypothetical protein [Anaerotignum sp.]|nr:hypothetical protein [Anaerotignum sp.]MCI7657188.1 hypothetical protein [Clostridia bacterium]MDY5415616.1 hypothetical protein [Anaerotignum sp.]